MRRAHSDRAVLERVAEALSASLGESPDVAGRMAAELRDLRAVHRAAATELAACRARDLLRAADMSSAGVRRIIDARPSAPADDLRALGQAISGEPDAVYIGASADPPFVVFAVSDGLGIDAGRALREALAPEHGRGGGSARAAQGVPPDQAAVSRVIERLRVLPGLGPV